MIPWTLLATAKVPGGDGELRLKRRGEEYSIMIGATELMNSRLSGSEKALASLVCERLAAKPGLSMLIGGLGMGFTLREALAGVGADAAVVVSELSPAVIAWARGPMAPIFGDCLSDPRVDIREGDVLRHIRASNALYDAILLDVDNGPGGLTRSGNDSLYDAKGIAACHAALRPGGILSVWSSAPDEDFTARLRRSGFGVDVVRVRANGKGGGARHVIWIATRGAGPQATPRPPQPHTPRRRPGA